jgi:hypothetical protein
MAYQLELPASLSDVHNLSDWLPGLHRPGSCHPGRLETEVLDV